MPLFLFRDLVDRDTRVLGVCMTCTISVMSKSTQVMCGSFEIAPRQSVPSADRWLLAM